MIVVSDTSSLAALLQVGRADLLEKEEIKLIAFQKAGEV